MGNVADVANVANVANACGLVGRLQHDLRTFTVTANSAGTALRGVQVCL